MSASGTAREPTPPVATLSMYDWPEVRQPMDQRWEALFDTLNKRGISAPVALDRSRDVHSMWLDPGLVVGQTCGWPYANILGDQVMPFARFHYDIDTSPPGFYRSVYIATEKAAARYLKNAESLAMAKRVAVNSDDSQSGFRVFREIANQPPDAVIPPEAKVVTGAHRQSVEAVARGEADLAAIDSVAFELAKRYDPENVSKVHVIGLSTPKPGLPLITSRTNGHLAPTLFSAVCDALKNVSQEDLDALLIRGALPAEPADYQVFAE